MIKRFTGYRQNINRPDDPEKFGEVEGLYRQFQNDWDHPQYEGVIWSDGSVSIKWLTDVSSQSIWRNLYDFLTIHGHPEYGTHIEFHDHDEWPREYEQIILSNSIFGKED
jgi:hypothetical protein